MRGDQIAFQECRCPMELAQGSERMAVFPCQDNDVWENKVDNPLSSRYWPLKQFPSARGETTNRWFGYTVTSVLPQQITLVVTAVKIDWALSDLTAQSRKTCKYVLLQLPN